MVVESILLLAEVMQRVASAHLEWYQNLGERRQGFSVRECEE